MEGGGDNEDEFYLSDDSDGNYEDDRRHQYTYNRLLMLEIRKHQSRYDRRISIDPGDDDDHPLVLLVQRMKKAWIVLVVVLQRLVGVLKRCISRVMLCVKGCRIEALVACGILYATLFFMMTNSTYSSSYDTSLTGPTGGGGGGGGGAFKPLAAHKLTAADSTTMGHHYQYLADLYGQIDNNNGDGDADGDADGDDNSTISIIHSTTPLFWSIPFSSHPIERVLQKCVRAERMEEGGPLVGLDTTGIELTVVSTAAIAKTRMSPNSSSNARANAPAHTQIIISPDIHQISTIFTPTELGRLFTIMKNPIHIAVDKYRYITSTSTASASQLGMTTMTLEEYATSAYVDDNWMTRALSGKQINGIGMGMGMGMGENEGRSGGGGDLLVLTQDDLDSAMPALSQKCFIGLYPRMHDFMGLLDTFFHWNWDTKDANGGGGEMMACRQAVLAEDYNAYVTSLYPVEGSLLWKALLRKNRFDMQLFRYAERLFEDESGLGFKLFEDNGG